MIHQTAIIDPTAKIADDVEIGPYSIIGANVEIDSGTWIGPHVVINGPTKIGKDNRIFQFASIGEEPQDLKYNGEPTLLEVGDRNTIREYVTFNRGTPDDAGITRVGSDNLFMAYAHVAHDCQVGNHIIFANCASTAGHVHVGDHAILGGFTAVHQFTQIGEHSFSGLGTIVNRDIPPYVIVAGNHAQAYGLNKNGLKRRGFEPDVIRALHKTFKLIVKGHKKREEIQSELESLSQQFEEVRKMIEFVDSSERGIVR